MAGGKDNVTQRLLVFEPSLRGIAGQLAQHSSCLDLLVMSEAGTITVGPRAISTDEAHPALAWISPDLFGAPAAREFMLALLKAPELKWVQSAAAGVDNPIFGQLFVRGVTLTTSHGQAVGMADYVLSNVLDHYQGGPERRFAQSIGKWRRTSVREICGTQWLVVGFGAVGQAVAQRARAFGGIIRGVRRDQTPHPLADEIVPPERIAHHISQADVIVLVCPLTPATRHIANGPFFSRVKDDAVLVNVGRGALVDESALLTALEAGRPVHAVLDVFETEPLPEESPFWAHPRVSVTAHCSGLTGGQYNRNRDLFLENLHRFLNGRGLLNEVGAGTFG